MFLIVGLGNPTEKYIDTRHNIGFMAINRLCEKQDLSLQNSKISNMTLTFSKPHNIKNQKVILAKPLPYYMNESGNAIRSLMDYFKIDVENLIILHDDIDLEFGKIRIKIGGGSGGHNGLKSIIKSIGSAEFIRIRMGIGRPRENMDPAVFVLKPFRKEELIEVDFLVENAADAAISVVTEGISVAMNRFN